MGPGQQKNLIMLCVAVSIAIIIVLIISLSARNSKHDNHNHHLNFSTHPENRSAALAVEGPEKFSIISREEWGAVNTTKAQKTFEKLPELIVISHTATDPCVEEVQCKTIVRNIQINHMEGKGFSDIGSNFLVGGDGKIYEGRGWNFVGAHTKPVNSKSIGISLIGTFDKLSPTIIQFDATKKLISLGVDSNKIMKDYKLYGHRQLINTKSPGDIAYAEITKWPHFENSSTPVVN